VKNDSNRNQTSIIRDLPQNFETTAFEFFHSEMGGQLRVNKTFHKLKQYFFVPSALAKLKDLINGCETFNLRSFRFLKSI